jgi:2-methylcitrate synthase
MAENKGKGLEGVVAARTSISDIDGQQGKLFYCGYDIAGLAEHASFEETVYLLHHLALPTRAQLDEEHGILHAEQRLDPYLVRLISMLGDDTNPMTVLRTVVSAAATLDPTVDDESSEANLLKAYKLIALAPQIVAAFHHLRTGGDAVEPRNDQSLAANFLYSLTGKQPDEQLARDFDVCLLLYADHTMNASTFAGRVAAATLADIYAAVTAAIATLQGPLHGGAIAQVRYMLDEIGSADRAAGYVRERLGGKKKIMGFGHRVYKTWDPRARILREMSRRLGERLGDTHWFEISDQIQQTVMEEKGLYPNVDFYTASVYSALGIPPDLYTTLFATARMAGWTAHIREQYADNRLIRPDSEYIGPGPRNYEPIDQRG